MAVSAPRPAVRSSTVAILVPPSPSGSSMSPSCSSHPVRITSAESASPGLRARVASAALAAATAEVLPLSSMACSMSVRRLENARSTALGTSRSSLRPLRRMSQASPSGASSARRAER